MKTVILKFEGAGHEFTMSKLNRKDLYGTKETLPELPDGTEAITGYLAADGQTIAAKRFMRKYSDVDGCNVSSADVYVTDENGKTLEKRESMFDVPPDTRESSFDELAGYSVRDVYMLDPVLDDDALAERLANGLVLMSEYAYNASYTPAPMMIIGGKDGAYALVLKQQDLQPLGPNVVALEIEEDSDDDAEELDFAMM